MEDTLREYNEETYSKKKLVLILVLMEDTLRGKVIFVSLFSISLNPCSNGRYSHRKQNLRILRFRGFDNVRLIKSALLTEIN